VNIFIKIIKEGIELDSSEDKHENGATMIQVYYFGTQHVSFSCDIFHSLN
jgi:hypothetical protein